MTTECPLTCYICGRTNDNWITVDLIGTLIDQATAKERFKEKHGKEPESFLFVCGDCKDDNPSHAKNTKRKYGVKSDPYR